MNVCNLSISEIIIPVTIVNMLGTLFVLVAFNYFHKFAKLAPREIPSISQGYISETDLDAENSTDDIDYKSIVESYRKKQKDMDQMSINPDIEDIKSNDVSSQRQLSDKTIEEIKPIIDMLSGMLTSDASIETILTPDIKSSIIEEMLKKIGNNKERHDMVMNIVPNVLDKIIQMNDPKVAASPKRTQSFPNVLHSADKGKVLMEALDSLRQDPS